MPPSRLSEAAILLSEVRRIRKAMPRTLYVCRKVQNAAEIIRWAKGQGFETTVPKDEMHVTITYSRTPVDWMKINEDYFSSEDGSIEIKPGSVRLVERLGTEGAVVLMFNSSVLSYRHEDLKRMGASWDHPEYQPHITISYDAEDLELADVEPYRGKIVLGPELFEEVNENYKDKLIEKASRRIVKVDEELGLVFGWAIICKVNGEDYYDLNIDKNDDGSRERVPENVSEVEMLKAADDFMQGARKGNEMHKGANHGEFVFAFPMTTEIAKALDIETSTTGLLVAYRPPPHVLKKYKDGTYTGFSIEGEGEGEEFEDD